MAVRAPERGGFGKRVRRLGEPGQPDGVAGGEIRAVRLLNER
jgi:hypothetical protein